MSLAAIAAELREATNADRVTIRLDDPDNPHLPVKAESLGAGVDSIRGDVLVGIKDSPVVTHLRDSKEILVQHDVFVVEPTAVGAFELYRIRAQLLAPLFDGHELHGLISVHVL